MLRSKALLQVGDNVVGLIQPYYLALYVLNTQTGHFHPASTSFKLSFESCVVLRIALFDGQGKPGDFFADLDAKRAGRKLIQRQLLAGGIDLSLGFGLPFYRSGCAELFSNKHKGGEDKTDNTKKEPDQHAHSRTLLVVWGIVQASAFYHG